MYNYAKFKKNINYFCDYSADDYLFNTCTDLLKDSLLANLNSYFRTYSPNYKILQEEIIDDVILEFVE